MVKLKNRYLLIELLFDANATGVVTETAIYSAICKQIATLYGDFGFAAAKSSLAIKVFDSEAATSIIRVSVESLNRLLASIPFVNSIANVPVVIKLLFIGSSIRSCEKALLRINRRRLYASLRRAETKNERKEVLDAIRATTGNIEYE